MKTWTNVGCSAKKLTLGFATTFRGYGPGDFDPSDAKKPYWIYAYNEVCRLDWQSDSDADKGQILDSELCLSRLENGTLDWLNFTTVTITRTDVKNTRKIIDYVVEAGLAGINWWSLIGDDFTGEKCKKGWFSMIRTINEMLTNSTTGSS